MKCAVPEGLKYFNLKLSPFLQKYVVYRKRKIYVGPKILLIYPLIKKIQRRKIFTRFIDQLNADAPITLNALKVDWTPAVLQNSYE
jgi:uroporphyrinogen-III synthase